jgi:hypothetical protein
MARLPTMDATVTIGEGRDAVVKTFDIAPAVCRIAADSEWKLRQWKDRGPSRDEIRDMMPLTQEERRSWLVIHDVGAWEAYRRLLEHVGGQRGVSLAGVRFKEIATHEEGIRRCREALEDISKAVFVKRHKGAMVWTPFCWSEYHDSVESAYDCWSYDEFEDWLRTEQAEGRENDLGEAAAYAAWHAREAPPFAYGTTPFAWRGLEARDVIQDMLDDNGPDAWQIIADSLAGHHEDALDDVEDIKGAERIVRDWADEVRRLARPDDSQETDPALVEIRLKGAVEDLRGKLENALGPWNAKQRVVSYNADRSVIVLGTNRTPEDCVAWCRRRISILETRIHKASNSFTRVWATPPEEGERLLSALREKGIVRDLPAHALCSLMSDLDPMFGDTLASSGASGLMSDTRMMAAFEEALASRWPSLGPAPSPSPSA